MAERVRCEMCDRTFKDAEGLAAHNKAKHSENISKEKNPFPIKKIRNWSILIAIVGLLAWGIFALILNTGGGLPPTDIEGHIEAIPSSHVLKKPMRVAIQKHMLEHADGVEGGRGGIIINYNCEEFECDDDLIYKLEAFAVKYNYVYAAPFKNMEAKIALTKLGRIETLKEYDETKIEQFIKV